MAAAVLVSLLALASRARAEPAGTFALVSDVHFNPFDPPSLGAELASADVADWPARLATAASGARSPHGADTNAALLASALDAIGSAAAGTDFAIVTGDFLAHAFEKKAGDALRGDAAAVSDMAIGTPLYVAGAVGAALPGKPAFASFGNTDSDCGDYDIVPAGAYLAATKESVRRLAGPDRVAADFDATWDAGGYYAARHPTVPDTLIVSLNDVLWSVDYRDACGPGGEAAAAAMLDWLRALLARQKAAGGHVWMIHHIPWGIDPYSTDRARGATCAARVVPFMREPFASGFLDALRDNAGVVTASFSGHVHFDDYRLLADASGAPVGADKIVPAISPIFGQNPGFQIFDYDAATGVPTDFTTWYLANLEDSAPADWRPEYRFGETYRLGPYSPASVAALSATIAVPGPVRDTFRRLYNVGHGALSPVGLPAWLCAIREPDPAAFTRCYCGG